MCKPDYSTLLPACFDLAKQAGEVIMQYYQKDETKVRIKSDSTPVTEADIAANDVIIKGLNALAPELPVLSEEKTAPSFEERRHWQTYWLVDPLDGTKDFIEQTGEFTVNIALISEHKPVLGVVYAPALNIGYHAVDNGNATKVLEDGAEQRIRTRQCGGELLTAVISSRHSQKVHDYLEKQQALTMRHKGSSLKLCMVAEGEADLYPRFGKTSEWDTAAGHCIINSAGGAVLDQHGEPLVYNTKPSLLNPEFCAMGYYSAQFVAILERK